MITLRDPEYRRLSIESSNGMLRHDGEWLQGNYEGAGQAIWRAGQLRLEMARAARQQADPYRALCDALSAAACFVKAGDLKWAELALAGLTEDGPILSERPDVAEELAKRRRQVRSLARRLKRFAKLLEQHPEWFREPGERVLKLLMEQREAFPAYARLYALLAYVENQLGQFVVAARHASLAAELDPEQPSFACVALVARSRVESNKAVRAWGEEQRARFPEDASLRLALAYLKVVHAHRQAAYRTALSDLEPLRHSPELRPDHRTLVLVLCSFLAQQLGDMKLYGQSLRGLGQLRAELPDSGLPPPVVAALERLIDTVAGPPPHLCDGQANGNTGDPRQALRELETTLLLTCVAA